VRQQNVSAKKKKKTGTKALPADLHFLKIIRPLPIT